MNKSELVKPQHLSRKAIIYIRQSSPHQVLTNQESLKLQYALKQRALDLGWQASSIEIVDSDLGQSARTAEHRQGFKDLVAQVTLGQVGIVLSIDVTRLSRNCSDWYPLLDICGFRDTLIADRDGVYDSSTTNGRLLLGLKGQISEMELHTLRMRLTAGLLNKAQRGDLALKLPVGLVRNEQKKVVKDPNLEVQRRIELVFETFLAKKTASKVLCYFNDHSLTVPRHDSFGDLVWKKPTIARVLQTLKNPAYAGAFVYGRTRMVRKGCSEKDKSQKAMPIEEWKIRVNDKYPAYVGWDIFEKIQVRLKDNRAEYDRNKTRGIPRPGAALLHGIVYCGECGHKMVVQYKTGTRYLCNYLRQQYRAPVCQYIPADPIDEQVVRAFFEALSPAEIDIYSRAMVSKRDADEKVNKARLQQISRLRYETHLAERQFNKVDPDNRLVASELERRWNEALTELKQAEEKFNQCAAKNEPSSLLTHKLRKAFENIGSKLPSIWKENLLSREQRKAILRCLVDKVVIHRSTRDEVLTRIIWKGGETTTLEIPITVGALADLSNAKELEKRILVLHSKGLTDVQTAEQLSHEGFRSPMRHKVLKSTVQIIRLRHRLFKEKRQSHPRRIKGQLTIPQIAQLIDVTPFWLYDRIHNGKIKVAKDKTTKLFLFPDRPKTLKSLKELKAGNLKNLRFSKEYQHA